MRKRNYRYTLRLNEAEMTILKDSVNKTGMTTDGYLRMIIQKWIPKPLPPLEYNRILMVLLKICNILDQTALLALRTGSVEAQKFDRYMKELQEHLIKIELAFTRPIKAPDGDYEDMESQQPC